MDQITQNATPFSHLWAGEDGIKDGGGASSLFPAFSNRITRLSAAGCGCVGGAVFCEGLVVSGVAVPDPFRNHSL